MSSSLAGFVREGGRLMRWEWGPHLEGTFGAHQLLPSHDRRAVILPPLGLLVIGRSTPLATCKGRPPDLGGEMAPIRLGRGACRTSIRPASGSRARLACEPTGRGAEGQVVCRDVQLELSRAVIHLGRPNE